ncbi:hypothetical protein LCM08_23155 [Salipiger pacificus]|nr:hypothetical protein [Alloyangia pacifica]MCA0947835.1 hypothetical protein [Alloyangia pacifica]
MTEGPTRKKRRSRRRRVVIWGCGCGMGAVLLVALLLGGGIWYAMGRSVSAPDWLRSAIEARLAEALPGTEVDFGDLRLRLQPDWLARIALTDVELRSTDGTPMLTLGLLEAGLAPTKLLQGEYELRVARVSGVQLTARRDAEGRLTMGFDELFGSGAPAPDIPTIMAQIDKLAADPRLSGLRALEADALTLRYEDARAGRAWTADGGRIGLRRDGAALALSGDVALLGRGDVPATLSFNAESPIGSGSASFGVTLNSLDAQDIATQAPALAWLNGLRAPISGSLRGSLTGASDLGEMSATLQIGAGVLQPRADTQPIPFEEARTYFSFDPATATLSFDEISVKSAIGTMVSDGRAVLEGLSQGMPDAMVGQFRFSRLEADPEGFFEDKLKLSGAETDWRLSFNPFRFELGRLRVTDPALPLRASGTLSAEEGGWHMALDAELDRLTPETLLAYWPPSAGEKARDWVEKNIYAGTFHDVKAALRLEPGGRLVPYLQSRFTGVELTYSRTLPRLYEGVGQLTFLRNRLTVALDSGEARPRQGGVLQGKGSSFVIPDLTERPMMGEVNVHATGSLEATLSFLDEPPLEVMKKANKPVALGTGEVAADVRIVTPLKHGVQREEITVIADGTVTGVESAEIVPGKVLSADELYVAVDDTGVSVGGKGDLSGAPFDGTWTQSFTPGAPGKVEGEVVLSEAVSQALGIGLPKGTFSGEGRGRVDITLAHGQPPQLVLTSDMAGLGVSLPQLGWRLSQAGTGSLDLEATLGAPVSVEKLALKAPGLTAQGSVALNADGTLRRLSLPVLRAGGWLDGTAVLTGRGRNAAPAMRITGNALDMRGAPLGAAGGSGGGGGPVEVAVNRLQVTDKIAIGNFQGKFSTARGINGTFTGAVGGRAPIQGDVVPQNGGTAIRIRARDAGDVLKGAGVMQNIEDGTFDLTLVPVQGKSGEYDGALKIEGTRMQKNPAVVQLLDGISVVGIIDQLNGPGIFFSEVEARFRMTPQQIILTRSSATGPSMGISMDGYANLATGMMDMQGVLSPIYVINGIGQLFSRKGEGLIGFNFNLRGPVADPAVSVNPLSVFTPGMFRDIFRRPPPQVSQ